MSQLPLIEPGKRAIISGRTGSGKSTLANWLLNRSPLHWIIINPKWTKSYNKLTDLNIIKKFDVKTIERSIYKFKYTVYNPTSAEADNEFLDAVILYLHQSYSELGLVIDELYTVHKNGIAGEGLISWLTRGRELKQSFIGLTQRPAFVSKFVYSEADYVGIMSLSMLADRKRVFEFTGRPEVLKKLDARDWLWYNVSADDLRYFGSVPLT